MENIRIQIAKCYTDEQVINRVINAIAVLQDKYSKLENTVEQQTKARHAITKLLVIQLVISAVLFICQIVILMQQLG